MRVLLVPVLLAVVTAMASPLKGQSLCQDISRDVAAAIHKDPSKTLMIVEDALVINETCAGEIVRSAIVASKADPALTNQIVETGIAVAPKMAGVITDAANSVSPAAVPPPQVVMDDYSGKNFDKNPLPAPVVEIEESFNPMPIRGIYLIQPPPTGIVPCDGRSRKCCHLSTSPCTLTP